MEHSGNRNHLDARKAVARFKKTLLATNLTQVDDEWTDADAEKLENWINELCNNLKARIR